MDFSDNVHLAVSIVIISQRQPCHQSKEEPYNSSTVLFFHEYVFILESIILKPRMIVTKEGI
jgi:hypothetical protein